MRSGKPAASDQDHAAAQAAAADSAERAVLSAVLLGGVVPPAVAAQLDVAMFAREAHQVIYRAMLACAARGTVVDPITLRAELDGNLERAGGLEYLAVLYDEVPVVDHAVAHARIVREHAHRRALGALGRQIERGATDPTMALDALREAVAVAVAQLAPASAGRFHLLTADELLQLPPPTWLLDGHLPESSLGVLYGPPGAGKSFLALAWAMAVATARAWLACATRRGPVVYVAAEGGNGLGQRVQAVRDAHALTEPAEIVFLREPVNLLQEGDVADLLAGAPARPALFVFDTMARCMAGGDENSAQDVGRVIAAADRLRRDTGAAVLLVHHTGKDGLAERGSSALRGAADAMFALKNEDGVLTLDCTKQKDSLPTDPRRLRLAAVGPSCVVEPLEGDPTPKALTGNGWKALRALFDGFEGGESSVGVWQRVSAIPEPSFYRTLKQLLALTYVTKRGKRYVVSVAGEAALRGTLALLSPDSHESAPTTLSHSGGPSIGPR
ncbi:MAG TPA: AAA family ATPase [Gemmatimonadales bacterium]